MSQARYMQLDPVRDHETIVKWMVVDTWKFDLVRATELALLKAFALPEVAKILVDTYEFPEDPQEGFDETDLPLSLFIENGYSSPIGMKAIQRIKRMNALCPISNQQMLYLLSTFVIEPIRWIDTYGWRPLLTLERDALFHFWIEVGRRLNIKDLFPSFDAMRVYNEAYEVEHMVYSEESPRLYRRMVLYLSRMQPFPVGHLVPWILPAIMSPQMCDAFHVKPKHQVWRSFLRNALKLRAYGSQIFPSRLKFRTQVRRGSDLNSCQDDQVEVDSPQLKAAKNQRRSEA